jgi:hypothetical protein
MAYKLGLDCTLTVDSVEIVNAKDVTLNIEAGDADVTTRAADGWRMHLPTLLDASIEFELLTGGADGTKLATLFGSGAAVDVEVGGGNIAFTAKMVVTNFGGSQPLEDAESVSVTLKPAPLGANDDPPDLDVNS